MNLTTLVAQDRGCCCIALAAQVEVAVLAGAASRRLGRAPSMSNGGVLAALRIVSALRGHLDLAGRQLRVAQCPRGRSAHHAAHLHHVLAAHRLGDGGGLRRIGRVADHLGHAPAVAQVEEDQAAVVAAAVHPAVQQRHAARVGGAELAAVDLARRAAARRPGSPPAPAGSSSVSIKSPLTVISFEFCDLSSRRVISALDYSRAVRRASSGPIDERGRNRRPGRPFTVTGGLPREGSRPRALPALPPHQEP